MINLSLNRILKISTAVSITILLSIVFLSKDAHCKDANLTVTNIMPIYVEEGSQNVLVTLKAHVTNHGSSDDFTIDVVGVDKDGYELQTVKMSGHVGGGETKVFLEQIKMPRKVYNQIVEWNLKKK